VKREGNMNKRIKITAIILVLAIAAVLIWMFVFSASEETARDILTSGFIEARDVAIAAEVGGRIVEIDASEGDRVAADRPIIELDDSLLKAQEQQSEANVKLAEAYRQQAVTALEGAKTAWENALEIQSNPQELETKIIAAQSELDLAESNLQREEEIENDWRVPVAEIKLDTSEKVLENFQKAEQVVGIGSSYDRRAKTLPAEGKLAVAELNLAYEEEMEEYRVSAAELRRDIALRALENLLDIRGDPLEITAAVDQAYSAYQTALIAVATAERQVEQAEASLEVIRVQMSKLSFSSPISGVVAAQHVEVGEIAQPGAPILTITELEEVTLTAYVSESKIGLVKLGQEVLVSVDSYPGESFTGKVVYISPRAVFTPRNIQLKEEREKMVFAVKIGLDNPEQKLKPGMPADARILTND
jgi:HlyD family secretion protein